MNAKIRLYVEHPLGAGQTVPLDREQAHYLSGVMRLAVGDRVLLFDGKEGEWLSEVVELGKRGGELLCLEQTRPLLVPPDLWLLFAPIKKARTDFIVEKATEMGAREIRPVQTQFTNSERIRRDRLQSHSREAAEQCGGTYVPEVHELVRLDRLLDTWPAERTLIFCDEALAGSGNPTRQLSEKVTAGSASAILIGPEGGFSQEERARLARMPNTVAISLGPRVLRADTAAVAALTLWQTCLGDWK